MRLVKKIKYRTVEYFGELLDIPAHHNYVVTDDDGFVYSFVSRPDYHNGCWAEDNDLDPHEIQAIALFDTGALDSEKTLVEYPIKQRDFV